MASANPPATRPATHTAYPDGTRPAGTAATRTETGISLARGPALVVGTILTAAGLYFLYKAHTFPPFSNFTQGNAPKDGNFFFGVFGANGWTGMFTAVVGGLLLFGAAHHLLAKAISLITGVALGAAAIIAVISGNVLGMAAANGWTELGWGVCAAILLLNTLAPRRRREVVVAEPAGPVVTRDDAVTRREPVAPAATAVPPATAATTAAPAAPAANRPVADEPRTVADAPRPVADEPGTVANAPRPVADAPRPVGPAESQPRDTGSEA